MKRFLKQKMAADPVLRRDLDLAFREEAAEVPEKVETYIEVSSVVHQCLGTQNENTEKLDHLVVVDPEKQKILNTIFHYKNKKPTTKSGLVKSFNNNNDDSDNEKKNIFVHKSILKKEPNKKKSGQKKSIRFGYLECMYFDQKAPIIPSLPKKTPKKTKKRRTRRVTPKPKKIAKVMPKKQTKIYQIIYEENSLESAGDLAIAEQIFLANRSKIDNKQEDVKMPTLKRKSQEELNELQKKIMKISQENGETFLDMEELAAKWKTAFSKALPSRYAVLEKYAPHKLSTELLAALFMFENCDNIVANPLADLVKKANKGVTNLTPVDSKVIKKPFVDDWLCTIKEYYPSK